MVAVAGRDGKQACLIRVVGLENMVLMKDVGANRMRAQVGGRRDVEGLFVGRNSR